MSSPSLQPRRIQARSGRQQIPVAAASQLLFHSDLPHLSPEQMLWVRVLLQLRDDIASGASSKRVSGRPPQPSARVQLTQEDKLRLDFVAVALGLPGDTLPRLVASAEEEYRQREERRRHDMLRVPPLREV
jgi:hypothetical protein